MVAMPMDRLFILFVSVYLGGLDHTIAYAGNVDGTLMGP